MSTKYDLFISFASEDHSAAVFLKEFFESLSPALSVFVANNSIIGSDEWREQIRKAISGSQAILPVITRRSILRPWVICEVGSFWSARKPVFPLIEDVYLKSSCPEFITMYQSRFVSNDGFFKSIIEDVCAKLSHPKPPSRLIKYDDHEKSFRQSLMRSHGPGEALVAWNRALYNSEIDTASTLTSSSSTLYVNERWGSLKGLSEKYRKKLHEPIEIIDDVSIFGDYAIVKYFVIYRDENNSIKHWIDVVIFEGGIWRVAPQYVAHSDLTPKERKTNVRRGALKP